MRYNEQRFAEVSKAYREGLAKAMADYPDKFMPGLTADEVATRALATVEAKGLYAVEVPQSIGWRNTCKALGIKHTYKSLIEYLKAD